MSLYINEKKKPSTLDVILYYFDYFVIGLLIGLILSAFFIVLLNLTRS